MFKKEKSYSNGNGNGLLFHMTQPISRSTIKAIWLCIWLCIIQQPVNALAGSRRIGLKTARPGVYYISH